MEREIRFPRTQEKASGGRPAGCPRCGLGRVRINGQHRRRLIDPRLSGAAVVRYRCEGCGQSWRVYPEGVNRNAPQTKCEQMVSATLPVLGLSYDKASLFLRALGCGPRDREECHPEECAGGGRESEAALWGAQKKLGGRPVVGVDETELKVKGRVLAGVPFQSPIS